MADRELENLLRDYQDACAEERQRAEAAEAELAELRAAVAPALALLRWSGLDCTDEARALAGLPPLSPKEVDRG